MSGTRGGGELAGGEQAATPLLPRVLAQIEREGPMPVADYMALCLLDPAGGYYTTREPFGAAGDFTTAPEISQMFGELCAAWLVQAWHAMGAPEDAAVVEIGPGRGTLMLDVARVLRRLAPALLDRLHLVEASPRLGALQRGRLEAAGVRATWHASVEALPAAPRLIVANELFDALPARQFVAVEGRWRERCVTARDGRLAFGTGVGTLDEPASLDGRPLPDGTIREVAPAREALMATLAADLARHGGAFLTFDYGHARPGALGDTLQAVRAHAPADPLEAPGEADLTTHVDFAALARAARATGAHVLGPIGQGAFLLGMGLLERAGALGANADETGREAIRAAVDRLAGPDAMGELFRAMAVTATPIALEPFGN